MSLVCPFNQLLDLRDLNTGVHSAHLAEWALHVAGELGLPESVLGHIEIAALLRDIGKIGIPDAILNKPARLSGEEYDLMKKHLSMAGPFCDRFREWIAPACLSFTTKRALMEKVIQADCRARRFRSDPASSPSSTRSMPWFLRGLTAVGCPSKRPSGGCLRRAVRNSIQVS